MSTAYSITTSILAWCLILGGAAIVLGLVNRVDALIRRRATRNFSNGPGDGAP